MHCTADSLQALRSLAPTAQAPYGSFLGAPYGCPDDCIGNFMYGFIASNVAAGATQVVQVQPQVRNQPRRLYLSETVADNFLLNVIEVGIVNLLGTAGSISASIFIPNSICPDFARTVCEVSQQVSLSITNQSGAAATFAATMSAYRLQ